MENSVLILIVENEIFIGIDVGTPCRTEALKLTWRTMC